MSIKGHLIVLLFFVVLISVIGFLFMLDTNSQITYSSTREFTIAEDAMTFLEDIANSAHSMNATIIYNKLSIESPPTVTFKVEMPVTSSTYWGGKHSEPFKYGEVVSENAIQDIWLSCLEVLGVFTVAIFSNYLFTPTKGE
jgi:hypothetical protein